MLGCRYRESSVGVLEMVLPPTVNCAIHHEWIDAEVSDFAMYDERLLSEVEINQVIAALTATL